MNIYVKILELIFSGLQNNFLIKKMASESTTSTAATAIPPVETPLTQEQEKYIKKFEDEILPEEKKILEKGTLMPTERAFFKKKCPSKRR